MAANTTSCTTQSFKQQLKSIESEVRRKVQADQRVFYDKLVSQLAIAGDLHDARTVYRTLGTSRRKEKPEVFGQNTASAAF